MIVDDAMFMRNKVARLLRSGGYAVCEACNGAEAVKSYFEEKPDAVLMDITMPVMTGIEAAKIIKGRDPDAKIIMVTALGQKSMIIEAIRAGARDFVVKPFDSEKLIEAVRKQCQG